MKINLSVSLLTLFIFGLTASCSKDNKTVAPGITAAQVNTLITNGTWKVAVYKQAGIDQAPYFAGDIFAFGADGKISVTGTETRSGTWSSAADLGLIKIPIAFIDKTNGPFKFISTDWKVLTVSDLKIEVKHTNADDGSIDLLTFEKI